MARGLKIRIYETEGLQYLCSENKGADDRASDLGLCFRIPVYAKIRFSHDAAHISSRMLFMSNKVSE